MPTQFTQCKVVLVDNNSTDDTVGEARTAYPGIHTLINSHKATRPVLCWGSQSSNQAAKVAEGDVLVILNPDTIATTGSLDKLAEALRAETVGAACGLLLSEEGLPQKGFTVRRLPTRGSMLAEVLLVNRVWPGNPYPPV